LLEIRPAGFADGLLLAIFLDAVDADHDAEHAIAAVSIADLLVLLLVALSHLKGEHKLSTQGKQKMGGDLVEWTTVRAGNLAVPIFEIFITREAMVANIAVRRVNKVPILVQDLLHHLKKRQNEKS